MSFKCDTCSKEFMSKYNLERHKNRKIPCNEIKKNILCNICNIEFQCQSKLHRHELSKKHISNYNIYNLNNSNNVNNIVNNNIINNSNNNIINNNIININISYPVNDFNKTNLNILSSSDINKLLMSDNKLAKIIEDFERDDDNIFGNSPYIILMFELFIKIFSKLNFNLAYSENHNCAIFSFFKTYNNYIEYHLIEINNGQCNVKYIEYEIFINEFLNLMKKINIKFNNSKFNILIDYIDRYKKMLFSEFTKEIIENKLLKAYNDFKEIKNSKELEDIEFNKALIDARNNAFRN